MTYRFDNQRFTKAEKARYEFLHEVGVCCVQRTRGNIEVAHIRYADSLFNKREAGMGRKPHWVWTVPLNAGMHRIQHRMGERRFWSAHGFPVDSRTEGPLSLALALTGFQMLEDVEGARAWLTLR